MQKVAESQATGFDAKGGRKSTPHFEVTFAEILGGDEMK